MYKQKGTGGARHGAKTAPQFRGGGKAFGPVVRSHAHDLPKKVRALALKHALSRQGARATSWSSSPTSRSTTPKTKALAGAVRQARLDERADHRRRRRSTRISRLAARNIPHIDVLPVQGINVYDILRREKLVLTKAAVEALQERFK